MTPPPDFSLRFLPASANFGPRAFRAPPLALMSHTWSFPWDPAAARVSGSSGDHDVENTFPCNRMNMPPRKRREETHHTEVARDDEADLALLEVGVLADVPDLDNLVCPAGDDASPDMRVHVQSRRSAIVCGKCEACR